MQPKSFLMLVMFLKRQWLKMVTFQNMTPLPSSFPLLSFSYSHSLSPLSNPSIVLLHYPLLTSGFWKATIPSCSSPLLVLVNSKSGDNQGVKFLRRFRQLLNPAQVFDLMNGGPQLGWDQCPLITRCNIRRLCKAVKLSGIIHSSLAFKTTQHFYLIAVTFLVHHMMHI